VLFSITIKLLSSYKINIAFPLARPEAKVSASFISFLFCALRHPKGKMVILGDVTGQTWLLFPSAARLIII
jgi:hypothetical protein